MGLLFSNFLPVSTSQQTYSEKFINLLENSDSVTIATGFISADSLVDLKRIIEVNGGPHTTLIVGMHTFEGVTRPQRDALDDLDELLVENGLGGVHHVIPWPFHGKVVSFSSGGTPVAGLVGSSNLSNILASKHQRLYEVDLETSQDDSVQLAKFLTCLKERATKSHREVRLEVLNDHRMSLSDQDGIENADPFYLALAREPNVFEYTFNIPLSTHRKSNLNTFNGKGRERPQGIVTPRSWYEVELIVGVDVTRRPGYPQKSPGDERGVITVVTDDGWKFKCRISGDNSKNFRSEGDLKILGRWIKSRLESMGALRIGDLVTDDTLEDYGRRDFTLAKFRDHDLWYLDFSVEDVT